MIVPITILALTLCAFSATAQEKPEGLFINSKAPNFKVGEKDGKDVTLKDVLKNGTVVLVFYRGNWCPYCNKHLKRLQDSLQLIVDKGAQVIAVTPEAAEGIAKTVEKTGATFTIVTDADGKIMKNYGVSYNVDERTVSRYKNADIDLAEINKQKNVVLPVPAVYIVNKEGTVDYRYF